MIFDEESASDAQKFLAPPKRRILEKRIDAKTFETKSSKQIFGHRKMKCRESSETRFGKVWCRSELCSRSKRPFEVSKKKNIEILKSLVINAFTWSEP